MQKIAAGNGQASSRPTLTYTPTMTTSTITWQPVDKGLPDAETNVMLGLASGFTCEGFCDGEAWRDVTAMPIEDDAVCAWAAMPMFDSHANTP